MEMETDRYAVIGNPVLHSLSPRIHALFAAQTGQAMNYAARLAPLDGFTDNVLAFREAGARGANVTLPFKQAAHQLATRLTQRARAAGAVNTLRFDADEILGDNTDGAGLVRDLQTRWNCPVRGQRVLLLGAGGAARGVIQPLLEAAPAQLCIINRSPEKAAQLAQAFGSGTAIPVTGGGFDTFSATAFDLIINATSAGLSNAALPLPARVFAQGSLAYEMLYGRDTPFMAQARAAGALVADGLGMLVEQAAESFFLWRGVRPQTAPVLAALRG